MAKYTIEELYRGDKYLFIFDIVVKVFLPYIDPHAVDGQE